MRNRIILSIIKYAINSNFFLEVINTSDRFLNCFALCIWNLRFRNVINNQIFIIHQTFLSTFPIFLSFNAVAAREILIHTMRNRIISFFVAAGKWRIIKSPRVSSRTKMIVGRFKWERNKNVPHLDYRLCKKGIARFPVIEKPSFDVKSISGELPNKGISLAASSLTFSSRGR